MAGSAWYGPSKWDMFSWLMANLGLAISLVECTDETAGGNRVLYNDSPCSIQAYKISQYSALYRV